MGFFAQQVSWPNNKVKCISNSIQLFNQKHAKFTEHTADKISKGERKMKSENYAKSSDALSDFNMNLMEFNFKCKRLM